jgi:hypothetical protein
MESVSATASRSGAADDLRNSGTLPTAVTVQLGSGTDQKHRRGPARENPQGLKELPRFEEPGSYVGRPRTKDINMENLSRHGR